MQRVMNYGRGRLHDKGYKSVHIYIASETWLEAFDRASQCRVRNMSENS